jgi:DNA recombination protein RmuC
MDSIAIALVILALATGAFVGWFLGSRPVADWKARHAERDGEAREHEAAFKRAIAELGDARIELATLKANAENFDKQIKQLNEARDHLLAQFKAAGGEVLSKAQEEFLKAAAERFGSAEKANKEAVAALLEPVNQRLSRSPR